MKFNSSTIFKQVLKDYMLRSSKDYSSAEIDNVPTEYAQSMFAGELSVKNFYAETTSAYLKILDIALDELKTNISDSRLFQANMNHFYADMDNLPPGVEETYPALTYLQIFGYEIRNGIDSSYYQSVKHFIDGCAKLNPAVETEFFKNTDVDTKKFNRGSNLLLFGYGIENENLLPNLVTEEFQVLMALTFLLPETGGDKLMVNSFVEEELYNPMPEMIEDYDMYFMHDELMKFWRFNYSLFFGLISEAERFSA